MNMIKFFRVKGETDELVVPVSVFCFWESDNIFICEDFKIIWGDARWASHRQKDVPPFEKLPKIMYSEIMNMIENFDWKSAFDQDTKPV